MIFLLVASILCIDRIKLKIVGDDNFLGMLGQKIVKVDYFKWQEWRGYNK